MSNKKNNTKPQVTNVQNETPVKVIFDGKEYTIQELLLKASELGKTIVLLENAPTTDNNTLAVINAELDEAKATIETLKETDKGLKVLVTERDELLEKVSSLKEELEEVKKGHKTLLENGGVIIDKEKLDPKKKYVTGASGKGFVEVPSK